MLPLSLSVLRELARSREKTDRKKSVSCGTVFHFYSNRFYICEKKWEQDGNGMVYYGNGNENDLVFLHPYFQNLVFLSGFPFSLSKNLVVDST